MDFHFTEANSWQYTFFVPQDISGQMRAMGGAAAYAAKLDSLFRAPRETTGRDQADITGLIGQYAHGNEPSHHMAYLHAFAGQPWKTQQRVREILDTMYAARPDGLIGNEDCGQMSAWYVLGALGFYSDCPGRKWPSAVSGSTAWKLAGKRKKRNPRSYAVRFPRLTSSYRPVTTWPAVACAGNEPRTSSLGRSRNPATRALSIKVK